jgi:hypothetical protein
MNVLDHPLLFAAPDRVMQPLAWAGHIPFGMFCIELLKPDQLVELGTHSGNSFNAFCQSVKRLGYPTRCYAVDTWEGDPQAGCYGPEILEALHNYQAQAGYTEFSTLLKTTFDDAAASFAAGSVDLLHIDGLHTYQAVRHDFETWLPKMSTRGVVLFHDTQVRKGDFGVWQLWQEVSSRYPSLEFTHSHGLGILAIGSELPEPMRQLLGLDGETRERFKSLLERLGNEIVHAYEAAALTDEIATRDRQLAARDHDFRIVRQKMETDIHDLDVMARGLQEQVLFLDQELTVTRGQRDHLLSERDQLLSAHHHLLSERDQLLSAHHHLLSERGQLLSAHHHLLSECDHLRNECQHLLAGQSELMNSTSWRITRPLRRLGSLTAKLRMGGKKPSHTDQDS